MATKSTSSPFIFVIHTNDYSGSFERNMCAFITGVLGECGVGDNDIPIDQDYSLFKDLISMEPDEHHVYRPVTIWPTPNVFNNGLGFHYREGEEAAAFEAYKKSHHGNSEPTIDMVGKYPAYQSVAIFLSHEPSKEQVELMTKRAKSFPKYWNATDKGKRGKLKVTGCELIKQENYEPKADPVVLGQKTFNGRFLMRRGTDRNGDPCVIIAGVGYGEGIDLLNGCDEMWVGDVVMRPTRKLKELRTISNFPNHTSVHEFLAGKNMREGDWLKEEKDGKDVPNEEYNGLGC